MSIEADWAELGRGELDSFRVLPGVEGAIDGEAGAGAGLANETQDGGIVGEWLAGPLLADLGKERCHQWLIDATAKVGVLREVPTVTQPWLAWRS